MPRAFFASDLHGRPDRYEALLEGASARETPTVFLGGDLLPHVMDRSWDGPRPTADFVADFLTPALPRPAGRSAPATTTRRFPHPGQRRPAPSRRDLQAGSSEGLWEYVHGRRSSTWAGSRRLRLQLRSAHALPAEGLGALRRLPLRGPRVRLTRRRQAHTHGRTAREIRGRPSRKNWRNWPATTDLARAICCSTPALRDRPGPRRPGRQDGGPRPAGRPRRQHRHPKEFIEERQPLLTLHGHVHESRSH